MKTEKQREDWKKQNRVTEDREITTKGITCIMRTPGEMERPKDISVNNKNWGFLGQWKYSAWYYDDG